MAEFQPQNRRDFLKYMIGGAAVLSGYSALSKDLLIRKGISKLTILYTNDVHSRIEPFAINDPKFPNQGGFARRASIINQIRSQEEHVLLLDAGDIFQGTPYFNLYAGELEYKLMSAMQYDCVTLGNHDFDLGMDNIIKQMPHASFDFVCANYVFTDTPLQGRIKPYKVFHKAGLKIGVFGLGIELDGLVDKKLSGNTQYKDPVVVANDISKKLRNDEKCDYVICLSHLGYKSDGKKINDQTLAEQTSDIDLIIGAHTHTFLDKPVVKSNSKSKEVTVTQVGWAGIWLGRFDVFFGNNTNKQTNLTSNIMVDNKWD